MCRWKILKEQYLLQKGEEISALQHFVLCDEVLKHHCHTVLEVLQRWQDKHLGLAQIQQVAAAGVYWEAQIHPTYLAHPSGTAACLASAAGGVDGCLTPCSREALGCYFIGMGWDAARCQLQHLPHASPLCYGPWNKKIPPTQGSTGLGGDASNLRPSHFEAPSAAVETAGKGSPGAGASGGTSILLQVDTDLREDWWHSQVSKPTCKVVFSLCFPPSSPWVLKQYFPFVSITSWATVGTQTACESILGLADRCRSCEQHPGFTVHSFVHSHPTGTAQRLWGKKEA